MADHAPIDVIRSHQDERASRASSRHEPTNPQSQPQEEQHADLDPEEKYKRDVPPDGGYGWVCVACVFWINAHTWGINSVSVQPYWNRQILANELLRATASF